MRCLILYQRLNGTPRRLLSVSQRLTLRAGESHEGDDPVPREFIEAAYILSEDQRPNPMVLQQKDMTPELIAEKAKKYNIIPEDYLPMSISWGGAYGGDYPTIVDDAHFNRDFNYEWDNMDHKRNYGQILGMHEWIHYGNFHMIYDGKFHPWGLYQPKQWTLIWLRWVLSFFIPYFFCSWLDWPFNIHTSYDRYQRTILHTGLMCDRSFSNTELEWLDVFLKVEQAKDGYANRSYADQDGCMYRQSAIFFGKCGDYSGRNRRGPHGEAPIVSERIDTYMVPAGPMSFKMGHNMPIVHPNAIVWNAPHPSHGHGTEMADTLSVETASDY